VPLDRSIHPNHFFTILGYREGVIDYKWQQARGVMSAELSNTLQKHIVAMEATDLLEPLASFETAGDLSATYNKYSTDFLNSPILQSAGNPSVGLGRDHDGVFLALGVSDSGALPIRLYAPSDSGQAFLKVEEVVASGKSNVIRTFHVDDDVMAAITRVAPAKPTGIGSLSAALSRELAGDASYTPSEQNGTARDAKSTLTFHGRQRAMALVLKALEPLEITQANATAPAVQPAVRSPIAP